MTDKNSKGFGYPQQIGTLIALFGGALIAGTLVSAGVWYLMTGRPLTEMANDMADPKFYYAIMAMQVISAISLFFLPIYFFAKRCYKRPLEYLGLHKGFNFKQLILLTGLLVLTFIFSDALAQLTKMIPLSNSLETKFKAMETAREAQEKALININTFPKYLISMIVIGVVPGILEELFFRGGLQNILTRWFKSPWVAILVTAFIFSAIHLSFYGFFVRFALGIFLGVIFYYSGNLWLSMLFHFLFNGVQVTMLYATSFSGSKPTDITEQHLPVWVGLLAFALIILLFHHFKKISWGRQDTFKYEDNDPDNFDNWIAKNS